MDDTSRRVGDVERWRDASASGAEDVAGLTTEDMRSYAATEREERDGTDVRTEQLRSEIEQTREDMSETIEAIQEKLRPGNIVANATERVKTATTERVREMADTANQTAQQAMDYTRETVGNVADAARQNPIPLALVGIGAAWWLSNRSRGSSSYGRRRYGRDFERDYGTSYRKEFSARDQVIDQGDEDTGWMSRIRRNPVPAALAGVGLTWLVFSGNEDDRKTWYDRDRYDRDRSYGGRWRNRSSGTESSGQISSESSDTSETGRSITETAEEMASRTKAYATDTAESVRDMARRRQNQLQRMIQENPLLVGAGALMLGAAFGLAVPETDAENELMGEARDTVMDRARGLARDAANQVQEAAGSVADAAKKVVDKTQS